jgi:hypothetical protein
MNTPAENWTNVALLAVLALIVGAGYVAVHFIVKYW